ncbi:MAG: SDR family NAD(P)-dependent oxidoreductase [Pseudomonadota bacterium]
MTQISGSAAAITGAASGIGQALALELAARGCDLALADRDEGGLKDTASQVKAKYSRNVSVHRTDVSDPGQIEDFSKAVAHSHPNLNILINNAGIALLGQFHEISQQQIETLMGINFWGVVHGVRAFLPQLQRQREAHIVNVSSIYGIIAPPGQTAYTAAKFAVRGFSESLRHELELNKSPVRLSVVHPGGVATRIVHNATMGASITDNTRRSTTIDRFTEMAKTTPTGAAERIIRGIEKNEKRILIGNDARFMDLLQRFRPSSYWAFLQRQLEKKYGPMIKTNDK